MQEPVAPPAAEDQRNPDDVLDSVEPVYEERTHIIHPRQPPLGLKLDDEDYVLEVRRGTQAEQLGIQVGSQVVSCHGHPVRWQMRQWSLPDVSDVPEEAALVVREFQRNSIVSVEPNGQRWTQGQVQEACRAKVDHVCDVYQITRADDARHAIATLVHQTLGSLALRRGQMAGPQRWRITTRLVLDCVVQVQGAPVSPPGAAPFEWTSDDERKQSLYETSYQARLVHVLERASHIVIEDVVQERVERVWKEFWEVGYGAAHEFYRLTPLYILQQGNVSPERLVELRQASLLEQVYQTRRRTFASTLESRRNDWFPLVEDDAAFASLIELAWNRYVQHLYHLLPEAQVEEFLQDMEQLDGYLAIVNGLPTDNPVVSSASSDYEEEITEEEGEEDTDEEEEEDYNAIMPWEEDDWLADSTVEPSMRDEESMESMESDPLTGRDQDETVAPAQEAAARTEEEVEHGAESNGAEESAPEPAEQDETVQHNEDSAPAVDANDAENAPVDPPASQVMNTEMEEETTKMVTPEDKTVEDMADAGMEISSAQAADDSDEVVGEKDKPIAGARLKAVVVNGKKLTGPSNSMQDKRSDLLIDKDDELSDDSDVELCNATERPVASARLSAVIVDGVPVRSTRVGLTATEWKNDRLRRTQEDGSMLPTAPPTQLSDGTFQQPVGRIPSGMSWNAKSGVWMPTSQRKLGKTDEVSDLLMDSSSDSADELDSNQGNAARRNATSSPGRPRQGTAKDPYSLLSDSSDDEVALQKSRKRRKPDRFSADAGANPDASEELGGRKAAPVIASEVAGLSRDRWTQEERKLDILRRTQADGSLLPAQDPEREEDGTFKRPNGGGPRGMTWSHSRGLWIPSDHKSAKRPKKNNSPHGNDESNTSTAAFARPAIRSEALGLPRNKWTPEERREDKLRRTLEDGSLLPAIPPAQLSDGTFKKPHTKAPRDTSWNHERGVWEPIRRESNAPTVARRPIKEEAPISDDSDDEPTVSTPLVAARQEGKEASPHKQPENSKLAVIGTRVYCEWENKEYYWGNITRVFKKGHSHQDFYSVKFEDGDELDCVHKDKFLTETACRNLGLDVPPPPPSPWRSQSKKRRGDHNIRQDEKKSKRPKWKDGELLDAYKLLEIRCQECTMCTRPDCERCSSCRHNKEAGKKRKQCCLQKMCEHIPDEAKAQEALGFPTGWKFFFSDTFAKDKAYRKNFDYARYTIPGLRIMAPADMNVKRLFRSAESAYKHCSEAGLDLDTTRSTFYEQIGVLGEGKSTGLNEDPDSEVDSDSELESESSENGEAMLTLAQLRRLGCAKCQMCLRKDCGRCVICVKKRDSLLKSDDICLRKMCDEIPIEEKAQPCPFLPDGWRVAFCKGKGKGRHISCQLCIRTPGGKKFFSLRAAQNSCRSLDDVDAEGFYNYIGARDENGESDHFLIGKGYYQQYVDVNGRTKAVSGTIISRSCGDDDVEQFTVAYSDQSRALANSIPNECGSAVVETQKLQLERALGGCIAYEDLTKETNLQHMNNLPYYWSWIVPDVRNERMATLEDGRSVPELTIMYRGFRLVLKAQTSTIPNAGDGVFLSCVDLLSANGRKELVLEPGELIDLGVYAPFRAQDKRAANAFLMKNFVHSLKTEMYAFDTLTPDTHQFDITDDLTGGLHQLAKEHIPAFVNECKDSEAASIHARLCPEGAVHYLLGHLYDIDGRLVIPADGQQNEVFINYGKTYEMVRVRYGYSSLTGDELEKAKKKLANEDMEYIHAIDVFVLEDVDLCVKYFSGIFSDVQASDCDSLMLQRSLIAAVLLHKRVNTFFLELHDDDDNLENLEAEGNVQRVLKASRRLVVQLLKMTRTEQNSELHQLFLESNFDEMEDRVVKRMRREMDDDMV